MIKSTLEYKDGNVLHEVIAEDTSVPEVIDFMSNYIPMVQMEIYDLLTKTSICPKILSEVLKYIQNSLSKNIQQKESSLEFVNPLVLGMKNVI